MDKLHWMGLKEWWNTVAWGCWNTYNSGRGKGKAVVNFIDEFNKLKLTKMADNLQMTIWIKFSQWKYLHFISISLKFLPKGSFDNTQALRGILNFRNPMVMSITWNIICFKMSVLWQVLNQWNTNMKSHKIYFWVKNRFNISHNAPTNHMCSIFILTEAICLLKIY